MTYELRTLDGKYTRNLTEQDFKTILSLAVRNGWRPSPKHIQNGSLRLNEAFSKEEGKDLAAALERGVQLGAASLPPDVVVAIFESIAVLRRDASKFRRP
jgi:hypothetical protein